MDPAVYTRSFEPQLTVFYCERCCDPALLDAAGAGNRCHLVPGCAGDVCGQRLAEAFAEGADGVLVLGCVGRSCREPLGDAEAFRHIHEGTMTLHRLGLDPARLRRGWITPRERARVPAMIAAYRRRLAALGPRRELCANGPATYCESPGTPARA